MKTSKPFATISYNTDIFLEVKLDDLVRRHKIDFWAFFDHLPEEDEQKAHKHLYIVPNGQIQTDELQDYLIETDPNNGLPLGCIRFKSSKWFDWYLYGLHDVRYLAMKGQSRKYHYKPEEIHCSDNDYLTEEIHSMDYSKLARFENLVDGAKQGKDFSELILSGMVPVQQVYAYEHFYDILNRNGKITHTPKIDKDSGEIMEPDEP